MAVNNSLVKPKFEDSMVEYESNGTSIKLSPNIIKKYLVSGNGSVSDQEVVMFLNLCKAQHLNPFLREAYLIKFGTQPATIVTGKEVFTKRARRNKDYAGFEAGVIVQSEEGGKLEYRSGTLVLKGENLVGGWAKIHIKGYSVPIEITASFSEYCQMKDGKPMSNWATKPATMIRKVALVQALREAFPEDLQGMYSLEETDVAMPLDETPIQIVQAAESPQDEPDPLA
jgi:phage recombination protein Bet